MPNGRINTAENQLEEASSSSEWWAIGFGALVIISVAASFVISLVEPPYSTFLFDSLFTEAGTAVGIVGEVAFGIWDSRIQTELRTRSNKRVEEAIERAATLEKEAAAAHERTAEIERITAWRHISPEQCRQIADAIRDKTASLHVLIEFERSDAEAFMYAGEIANIFNDAGVKRGRGGANSWLTDGTPTFGLFIGGPEHLDLKFFTEAFIKAGVSIFADPRIRRPYSIDLPDLYIFVATKPPPSFVLAAKADSADANNPQTASATRE